MTTQVATNAGEKTLIVDVDVKRKADEKPGTFAFQDGNEIVGSVLEKKLMFGVDGQKADLAIPSNEDVTDEGKSEL